MAISETLKNAVNGKDIKAIRGCFYTIILSDPHFNTNSFEEALAFVKSNNIEGFMSEHDGEGLLPEEEWNEGYFDILASKLQDNFSEERIEQLKKVAKKISVKKSDNVQKNYHVENDESVEPSRFNSSFSRKRSIEDEEYPWIGYLGAAILAYLILRRIFKGGR